MARRFVFRFQTLLRVRKRQEDSKSRALAEVRRDIRIAEQRRDEIAREQARTLEHVGESTRQKFDANDILRYYQYERHLARVAVDRDAAIAQLKGVERERLVELEEAMKKRRVVERLRERQEAVHMAEANKEEQTLADEAAGNLAAVARSTRRR